MLTGYDADKCRRRNHIAARRDLIDAVPIRLVGPGGSAVDRELISARGTLPKSNIQALERINALRGEGAVPLTLDQVYIHYAEAANTNYVPSHHFFLGSSTLRNFKEDADTGVAFMNAHRTGSLSHPSEQPYGRTFAGRYESYRDGDEGTFERTLFGFYMMAGVNPNGAGSPSTDDLHAMIDGGTAFDVSVGMPSSLGWTPICDVCGNDLNSKDCTHVPGTHRNMSTEEKAAQKARRVAAGTATYTVHDAHMNEVSGVYDGAVPGAGYRKALALAASHQLSASDLLQAKQAYVSLSAQGDFDMQDEFEEITETLASKVARKLGWKAAQSEDYDADEQPAKAELFIDLGNGLDSGSNGYVGSGRAAQDNRLQELEGKVKQMEAEKRTALAASLVDGLRLSNKVLPAEVVDLTPLVEQALIDDEAAAVPCGIEGGRAKALVALYEGRQGHVLTKEFAKATVKQAAGASLLTPQLPEQDELAQLQAETKAWYATTHGSKNGK